MERMVIEMVKPELDKKVNEAPSDDKQYVRTDNSWTEVSGGGSSGGGDFVQFESTTGLTYAMVDAYFNQHKMVMIKEHYSQMEGEIEVFTDGWHFLTAYVPDATNLEKPGCSAYVFDAFSKILFSDNTWSE